MPREIIDLAGGKSGVVLIHGVTGSPFELRYLAKQLNKAGFTVKVPILAGHEGDIKYLKKTTWQDWYKTIEEVIIELDKSCNEIFVGGLCAGALLSLHAAYKCGPIVKAVAAMSTTIKHNGWGIPWYGKITTFLNNNTPLRYFMSFPDTEACGIKHERLSRIVTKGLKDNSIAYYSMPGVTMYQINKLSKVVVSELSEIITPTIILHSIEDDIATIKNVDILEGNLASKIIHKVILDDSYHVITMDNQRDIVAKEIIAFFKNFIQQRNVSNVINKAVGITPLN